MKFFFLMTVIKIVVLLFPEPALEELFGEVFTFKAFGKGVDALWLVSLLLAVLENDDRASRLWNWRRKREPEAGDASAAATDEAALPSQPGDEDFELAATEPSATAVEEEPPTED
ncbi:MAG: hypothetical protein VX498_14790 [Myxococcota bacterium]|nr:hypothetical protein [Myxococcota bacterium]